MIPCKGETNSADLGARVDSEPGRCSKRRQHRRDANEFVLHMRLLLYGSVLPGKNEARDETRLPPAQRGPFGQLREMHVLDLTSAFGDGAALPCISLR